MNEQMFLQDVVTHPDDLTPYLILADWLEEKGEDDRAHLLRLRTGLLANCHEPNYHPERRALEPEMVGLLCRGVMPPVPRISVSLDLFHEMHFHFISPGLFLMGSPRNDPHHRIDEPRFPVTIREGFYLGVHPVTLEQWYAVMGNTRGVVAEGPRHPVSNVSWNDCQRFINKLREKENRSFRLPTEAEWESACRAGTTTHYFFGNTMNPNQASYTSDDQPPRAGSTPVGSYPPNAWGLYDMHGNVREWCQDWYVTIPIIDPENPQEQRSTHGRVVRGGSWQHLVHDCRCASRTAVEPGRRSPMNGFRLAINF